MWKAKENSEGRFVRPWMAMVAAVMIAALACGSWAQSAGSNERDGSRKVEVVYSTTNIGVWNNAIFANGQAGNAINGNVSVHGGVHVLGETVIEGDDAISTTNALDLSGTSFIRNSYEMGPGQTPSQRIWESVPSSPTTTVGGLEVGYLNANLRVKNGNVNLEGNAMVGLPDNPDNVWKEQMEGVYVTGRISNPGMVFSDNGHESEYDLGNKVPFPRLDDDYLDPADGLRKPHPDGGYYSHQDYFTEVLMDRPAGVFEAPVLRGDLRLRANGNNQPFTGASPFAGAAQPVTSSNNFYFNATTGEFINGGDVSSVNPGPSDDFILWDASARRLRANGQIVIEGNLEIRAGNSAQNQTVEFTGKAAIMVVDGEERHAAPNPNKGNITITANLLSLNADGTHAESFPNPNLVGFMADGNMTLGGGAQLSQMGAFYAEGTVTNSFQTHTVGTIVAGQFDFGSQVPNIYQVPVLANSLPFGMIGERPIHMLQRESWRELSHEEMN